MKALIAVIVLMLVSLSVRTNEYGILSFNGENKIFIITLDGFRWQEVFGGADPSLLNNSFYTSNGAALKETYGGETGEERRKRLMPFFWNFLARNGEFYGNREQDSYVNVSNPYALSYPGYNELLTGSVDLTVFNNGTSPNHNLTFLDQLNATKTYGGKVAAFASWDAFPAILNKEKTAVFVNCGEEGENETLSAEQRLNPLRNETDDHKNTRDDSLTYLACKEYVGAKKPSVVFLSFSGTDEAAHQKKYGEYLEQAAKADRMIGDLWQYLQTLPEYKNKTSFVLTTDHGRGALDDDWYTHGLLINGSSQTWMALLGPSVSALGERKSSHPLYLKNVKNKVLQLLAQRKKTSAEY